MSLALVCVPLEDWSLQKFSGLAFLVTWAYGLNLASGVSVVKSPPTFILLFQLFQFPLGDFLTFILTWWVLCPLVKVSITS